MAILNIPDSFTNSNWASQDNFKYSIDGGGWDSHSQSGDPYVLPTGATSGNLRYRAYIYIPPTATTTSDKVNKATLKFTRDGEYNNKYTNIYFLAGTTAPSSSTTGSGLQLVASNFLISKGTSYSIDVTDFYKPETGGYFVFLNTTTNTYCEIVVKSDDFPHLELDYTNNTKAGAPTSLTINKSICIPGDKTITATWSGATAGTGNSIEGYQLQQSVNGGAWTNIVEKTTSSSSHTFTAPSTRGATVKYRIRTIVNNTAYNSAYYTSTSTLTINSKPTAPTISGSATTTITSTSTGVTFTVAKGTDVNTSQTITLRYATSDTAAGEVISGSSITLGAGTYYFWTFDGLEKSSSVTRKIVKNTKPTLTVTSTGTALSTARGVSGYSYVIAPKATAKASKTSGTYYFQIGSGTTASNIGNYKALGNNTTGTYSLTDVRNTISSPHGKYYRIRCYFNDGIEDSSWAYGTIYYIPQLPANSFTLTNQHSSTNIASGNYFYKNIRFTQSNGHYDTGFDTCSVEYKLDTGTNWSSATTSSFVNNTTSKLYANVVMPTGITPGGKYGFRVTLSNSKTNYSYTYNLTNTLTRIKDVNLKNLSLGGWNTYKPYTDDASHTFSMYNWFGKISSFDWEAFGLKEGFKIKVEPGAGFNVSLNASSSSDTTLSFDINQNSLFESVFNSSLGKNSTHNTSFTFYVESLFGRTHTISQNLTVDFREMVVNYSNGKIDSLDPNNTSETLVYIKEGVKPVFTISDVGSYNGAPKCQIQIKRGTGSFENYGESFSLTEQPEQSGSLGQKSPIRYGINNYSILGTGLVGQLTKQTQYTTYFRLVIYPSGLDSSFKVTQDLNSFTTYRHIPGKVTIDAGTFADDALTYSYNASILGFDLNGLTESGSIEAILQFRRIEDGWDNPIILSTITDANSYYNSQNGANIEIEDFSNLLNNIEWTTGVLRLKVTTNSPAPVTSYTTYSNDFTIYNIAPTFAYRKNALGINVRELENEDILLVSAYNTKNRIRFIGTREEEDGSLKTATITINLTTGIIEGAVIDSGSW